MSIKKRIKNWRLPLPDGTNISHMPCQLESAKKNLEQRFINIRPEQPSLKELENVFLIIYKNYKTDYVIDKISVKYLKRAPWILFNYPKESPGILGSDNRFAELYMRWIISKRKARVASLLLFVFLRDYPIELTTYDQWRNGIRGILSRINTTKIALLLKRCEDYHLLDTNGFIEFNNKFIEYNNDPEELMEKAGLSGQLEIDGFSLYAYKNFADRLKKELYTGKYQANLLRKFIDMSEQHTESAVSLRYASEAALIADTLLMPYAEQNANEKHCKTIQEFLVEHLGDPRVTSTGWIGVSNQSKDVIYGWLVEATLKVFFKILDATADKIWRYRHAFWNSYYKKGVIKKAWAVLGKDAAYQANMRKLNDEKIRFGELTGSYSNSQSVLLMEIGNLVIAEWSHNGKCRIWHKTVENEHNIPIFYNTISPYSAASLRKESDFEQVHHASDHGTWQEKIAYYIAGNTNIQNTYSEFMPLGY